jgi:hypothetical protein
MSKYLLTECPDCCQRSMPVNAELVWDFQIVVIIEISTNIEGVMVVANIALKSFCILTNFLRNAPPLLLEHFGYLGRVKLINAHGEEDALHIVASPSSLLLYVGHFCLGDPYDGLFWYISCLNLYKDLLSPLFGMVALIGRTPLSLVENHVGGGIEGTSKYI